MLKSSFHTKKMQHLPLHLLLGPDPVPVYMIPGLSTLDFQCKRGLKVSFFFPTLKDLAGNVKERMARREYLRYWPRFAKESKYSKSVNTKTLGRFAFSGDSHMILRVLKRLLTRAQLKRKKETIPEFLEGVCPGESSLSC
jgi:hypothetical protein